MEAKLEALRDAVIADNIEGMKEGMEVLRQEAKQVSQGINACPWV